MNLVLPAAFPAPRPWLRKVLRQISDDMEDERRRQAWEGIIKYCREMAAEREGQLRELANSTVKYRTLAAEKQPEIDRLKNRLDSLAACRHNTRDKEKRKTIREKEEACREELKDLKETQAFSRDMARSSESAFKKFKAEMEKLRQNAQEVEEWMREDW